MYGNTSRSLTSTDPATAAASRSPTSSPTALLDVPTATTIPSDNLPTAVAATPVTPHPVDSPTSTASTKTTAPTSRQLNPANFCGHKPTCKTHRRFHHLSEVYGVHPELFRTLCKNAADTTTYNDLVALWHPIFRGLASEDIACYIARLMCRRSKLTSNTRF